MAYHWVADALSAGKMDWETVETEYVWLQRIPAPLVAPVGSWGGERASWSPLHLEILSSCQFLWQTSLLFSIPHVPSCAPLSSFSTMRSYFLCLVWHGGSLCSVRSLETHQRLSLTNAMTWRLIDHQMSLAQGNINNTCQSQLGAEWGMRPQAPCMDLVKAWGDYTLHGVYPDIADFLNA